MKSCTRLAILAGALFVATSLAQTPGTPAPSTQQAKSKALQERQSLLTKTQTIKSQVVGIRKSLGSTEADKIAALDAQVTQLQKTVAELEAQLAKEPRYFDDPEADPLRP